MHSFHSLVRRRLLGALGAAACLAAVPAAHAQGYPGKPVKLVVPYPPGGPTDIVARVVAQKLSEQTGQQFIVDNRPGAGGNTGAELVARSAPDGYMLLVATTAHAINPSLFRNLGYRLTKDLAPVSLLTSGPLVIVANPRLPARNVTELIALAKARPGQLNFASSGNGQSTHLSAELFASMAGVKMTHIPYKGSAPALTDVMGGQAQLMFDTMLSAMPHVKGGKLKALAVTSARRSPAAPDLPTVASGLPGYEAIAWNGLLAPAGTPPEVIARLGAELKKALALPEVKDKFEAQGFAAAWNTPEAFGGFLNAEVEKWAQVVKVSGATLTEAMIDPAKLKAWAFEDIVHRYGTDDTLRYALALGLGRDPTDAAQLKYVNDTVPGTPLALPTLAVVLGFPGSWMQDPATGIDFTQIVHGEEKVVWHRPLPASGTVVARHRVTRVVDKGPGRGATITYDKDLFDQASGEPWATVTHTTFARGNGGFATEVAPGDAAPEASKPVPQRAPDIVVDIPTLAQQALLYRLCADRNPLHSDPAVARAAGFERPILHGLCTWGIAGHAVLAHACGNDPARLRSLFARFSAPVFPGETLRIEMHREGPHDLAFRVRVPARERTVLDHGHARIDA